MDDNDNDNEMNYFHNEGRHEMLDDFKCSLDRTIFDLANLNTNEKSTLSELYSLQLRLWKS